MQSGEIPPIPGSAASGKSGVTRATARNALLVNVFATPGLGSLMAGRFISGLGQLALAVTGFVLVMIWFVRIMIQYYQLAGEDNVSQDFHGGIAITGAVFFVAAWLWGFVTGVQVWRKSRPPNL